MYKRFAVSWEEHFASFLSDASTNGFDLNFKTDANAQLRGFQLEFTTSTYALTWNHNNHTHNHNNNNNHHHNNKT